MARSGVESKQKRLLMDGHVLVESLRKCRREDGSVSTDHYLSASNELVRMFHQMGRGLGLCLHDVDRAVKALEIRRVSGTKCHYDNVELMLEFESTNQQLAQLKGRVMSGTRALVKLHHTQHFMLEFLKELRHALDRNTSFSASARVQVYQNTLAKYHSRFAQAAAQVLLAQTAGRHEMMRRLQKSCHGDENPQQLLTSIIEAAVPLDQHMDDLMKNYDL